MASGEQIGLAVDLRTGGADLDIDDTAVLAPVLGLEYRSIQFDQGPEALHQFFARPLRIPVSHVQTGHFFTGITQHFAESVIGLHDIAVDIHDVDTIYCRAHQRHVELHQHFISVLDYFALGNVAYRADDMGDPADI